MKQLFFILFIFLIACKEQKEHATLQQHLASGKWVDLSYDFSEKLCTGLITLLVLN